MKLNRRQFVRAVGGIVASTTVAGCSAPVNTSNADRGVTETVIRDAPEETDGNDGGAEKHVTESRSKYLAMDDIQFQRAGDKGLLVAGDLENTATRAFEDVYVEVTLYDENDFKDDLLDSTDEQEHRTRLAAGETWQWTTTFRDRPLPEIDYYAVTARGIFD